MYRNQRLQEVVHKGSVAAHIPSHAEIMERHEDTTSAYEAEPELSLAQGLVHHSPRHLREPEVSSSENAAHRGHSRDQVEMADDKVSRMEHDVDRRLRQKEAANSAADKHRDEAQRKQRCRVD